MLHTPPPRRPQAPRVERALAREVGRFIVERTEPGERPDPLLALVHISRRFPGVSLDTALCGFVFRKLFMRRMLQ
jgi:hypothetical protein